MSDSKESRRLRIVPASNSEAGSNFSLGTKSTLAQGQMLLFPEQSEDFLGATNPSRLGDVGLVRVLKELQPRWILDVRPVPFFNIGSLTRHHVFELLGSFGGHYCGVEGRINAHPSLSPADSEFAHELAQQIASMITKRRLAAFSGPVLLLHNVRWGFDHVERFASHLQPMPKAGWRIKTL